MIPLAFAVPLGHD